MKSVNTTKSIPIEPEIELDGGYAYCPICTYEVYPHQDSCSNPKCQQLLDWSWFRKKEEC